MEALRGWTSGLANPHFVIDAPGGGGKIPLLPEYVLSMTDEEVVVRNFRGDQFVYKQPQEEELAGAGKGEPEYLFQPRAKKPRKRTAKAVKGPAVKPATKTAAENATAAKAGRKTARKTA